MTPDSTGPGLREVYRQRLLELFRNPSGSGEVVEGSRKGWSRNRTCGDEVSFFLTVDDTGIGNCRQQTAGCAISTATASLLADALSGLDPEEAVALLEETRKMVFDGGPPVDRGELKILATVNALPSRHECVGVALDAVADCLKGKTR